jgi:hypothetical protein
MAQTQNCSDIEIETLLADRATSFWLKSALEGALARDAVDAAVEAKFLAEILSRRLDGILASPSATILSNIIGADRQQPISE